ncbi:MAG TPA: DUF1569 domain-containing protein [Pyrinomonadaceae bacterium]|jgi:hypothetical protein
MRSFYNESDRAAIVARLRRLRPESVRRWGRMTPHQAVCHLSDAFRATMGERAVSPAGGAAGRTLLKFIALKTPLPWPKGFKTRPEVDQEQGGTRPVEFARDVAELERLIARFTRSPKDFEPPPHPVFGVLTEREWLRWGYLHMDHHLRQFGV